MKPTRTLLTALLLAPLAALHTADHRIVNAARMIHRTISVLILLAGVAFAAAEAEQARLFEIVLAGAEQGRAAGALAWCLHDYPIKNPNESHFGLVRGDGSLKPAAIVLRETFSRWSKP